MKKFRTPYKIPTITCLLLLSGLSSITISLVAETNEAQFSQSENLYDGIKRMDSLLFDAFNNRDIETIKTLFAKDLEFFHDKNGLSSYAQSIESLQKLFIQDIGLRRELVEGSLEVYPINNYGAIQVGLHQFCHFENGVNDCGTFKFVHVWKKQDDTWKLTRIISYDH